MKLHRDYGIWMSWSAAMLLTNTLASCLGRYCHLTTLRFLSRNEIKLVIFIQNFYLRFHVTICNQTPLYISAWQIVKGSASRLGSWPEWRTYTLKPLFDFNRDGGEATYSMAYHAVESIEDLLNGTTWFAKCKAWVGNPRSKGGHQNRPLISRGKRAQSSVSNFPPSYSSINS